MKACAVFLIVGGLIGCSNTPLDLPTCEIPGPSPEIAYALNVPEMPSETSSTDSTATFDLPGLLQLERVRQASIVNSKIATQNALALEARNEEITNLIECSKYQKIWMEVREDMLESEKFNHKMDNYWYRGIIVLIGLGVAL